jgi:hypothetical protein
MNAGHVTLALICHTHGFRQASIRNQDGFPITTVGNDGDGGEIPGLRSLDGFIKSTEAANYGVGSQPHETILASPPLIHFSVWRLAVLAASSFA